MISIYRHLFFIKLGNRYFNIKKSLTENGCLVTGFSHSLVQIADLQPGKTVHIDLRKSEEALFAEIEKENRRQIRKADRQQMQFVVLEQPNITELKKFQRFYNSHAKLKHTFRCSSYNLQTLKKLADNGALTITYMTDFDFNTIYAYRVYVTDGEMVMTLYSASNTNLAMTPVMKRRLSEANRNLMWKNILRFKEKGVKIFDMGGLTDEPYIQKFKMGFGGNVVTVYSGYTASSQIGKVIIKLRECALKRHRKK